ncbi:probable polygalacturonase At1g80170 [Phoenix dactylifera]|uniref:endo-polygalacturonase n=1 Tax=Phoenix dactylifera TaxID=42345 RepID=A0A8B7D491_PHODC|nr:probable polygalacturonase At1g80170 [Phoenix dactylifera]
MSYFSPILILMLVVPMMGAVSKGDGDFAPAEDIGLWTAGTDGEEGQEGDEYDELDSLPIWGSERVGRIPVNVDSFGAVGDGVADDTQAFLAAWETACSIKNAVFLVPERRNYKVNATRLRGPCEGKLLIQVSGTIVAPDEPKDWDPKNPRQWLSFSELNGVRIQGGGIIDGSGSKWWASSCKINRTNPCRGAPTALTIDSSSGVRVKDLTIQNAQQMHFTISRSDAIRVSGLRVRAPSDSPNTDGIHISESTNVAIQNCHIGTGDDCISIVNASSIIKMKNIVCGPGHGISIGSLGKDNTTAMVTAIVLDTAILTGTTNGLRIKTWQGGSGYVKSVRFENVKMDDVQNPIIIDQFYCDSPTSCKNQTSAVKISQVLYRNISGTSRTPNAMKFACSDTVPCSNIVLNNINLERENGIVETFCNCATGFDYGFVRPAADCLRNDKTSRCDGTKNDNQSQTYDPIHTEL